MVRCCSFVVTFLELLTQEQVPHAGELRLLADQIVAGCPKDLSVRFAVVGAAPATGPNGSEPAGFGRCDHLGPERPGGRQGPPDLGVTQQWVLERPVDVARVDH